MIERPLLTPDELKSLPKGQFVVMKTGVHPMRVKLKLFFKWGIEFDEDNPYAVPDHGGREVQYAEKKEIMDGIIKKYHPDWIVKDKPATDGGSGISGQNLAESESHEHKDGECWPAIPTIASELKLIAASPHPGFENRWSLDWQKRYAAIMSKADLIKEVCTHYSRGVYQVRNEWMVDHSARVIAIWNGKPSGTKNTVDYANRKNVPVVNVHR